MLSLFSCLKISPRSNSLLFVSPYSKVTKGCGFSIIDFIIAAHCEFLINNIAPYKRSLNTGGQFLINCRLKGLKQTKQDNHTLIFWRYLSILK